MRIKKKEAEEINEIGEEKENSKEENYKEGAEVKEK